MAKKANNTEKKEVMKSNGNTNALVMSNNQPGNWGGMNYSMGMNSVTQGMGNMSMGGQGQQQPMMNQGYGYPQQQQQQFGMGGGYGYGQPMGNAQQTMQNANQGQTTQQMYGQGYQQGYGQPRQF